MLTYSLRRLLWTPVLLLIISFFVFVLGTYGPGDPVEVRLGHNYTPERAERLRDRLGLNDPFFVQYGRFVGRAVRGDLGESLTFQNRDVITLIAPKLLTSAQLNIAGSIIAIGFGVPLGFYAARRQGTWIDPTLVFCALIIFALPVFFTGPFAILIFAVNLDWVPVSGWGGLFDYRVVLPALTTGLPGIAIFVRLMRASTLGCAGAGIHPDRPLEGPQRGGSELPPRRPQCAAAHHHDPRLYHCGPVRRIVDHRTHVWDTGHRQVGA